MQIGQLPEGLELARTTPEFTATSTPTALRRSHVVAAGVWGVLVVRAGAVTFRFDDGAEHRIGVGDRLVIPPATPHAVEPDPDAQFVVEFHRPPRRRVDRPGG